MKERATILILGNGFDLEHGLPTRYTDFIEYIDSVKESKAYKLNPRYAKAFHEHIKRALGKNRLYEIITSEIKSNKNKLNWVDFEHEIALFMMVYEEYYYQHCNKYDKYKNTPAAHNVPFNVLIPTDIDPEELKEDFDRLRYAFEMYISKVINRIKTDYRNKTILDIDPDIVITFNYSNTYERLYGRPLQVCHIHGEARMTDKEAMNHGDGYDDSYRTGSHIVFGMDEYLEESERKKKTDFIHFRKYYQRLSLLTDRAYRVFEYDDQHIYVFGYSMNSEDAVIIKQLIEKPNAPTTIYYHDEKTKDDILKNLLKIFDPGYLDQRYFQCNNTIVMEKQGERIIIEQ